MRHWSIAALAALMIAVACSPDDFVDYELPGIHDGAGEGVSKTMRTDGSEQASIVLKTGATLTVPKSAVDHAITLGMERPDDKQALNLVKSVKSLDGLSSAPYVLTPHGTKFKQPVTVEIPVSKNTQKKLVVGWLENEADRSWKKLGTPEVRDGLAKIEIDHFSVLVLMEEEGSGFDTGAPDTGGADASAPAASDGSVAGDGDGGSDADPSSGRDAGVVPSDQDAGAAQPSKDGGTGTGGADAGVMLPDAGAGVAEAGVALPDAAAAQDAGAGPFDAGVAPDAGTGADADGGAAAPDGGTGLPDAALPNDAAAQLPDALAT